MSPVVLRIQTALARLAASLQAAQARVARTVGASSSPLPAVFVITVFALFQAGNVAFQSFLPSQLKSGFGFNIPWQMFASPYPATVTLQAVGVTRSGERIVIPLHDEIFTHYRGLARIRAFEEARWLMSSAPDGDMDRKRILAEYLRDRMAAWGIDIVEVELKGKTVPDDGGPTELWEIGTFNVARQTPLREPE